MVTGNPAESVLVWRPAAYVHELCCGDGPLRRLRADAMLNFAIAQAHARMWPIRDAEFVVLADNLRMLDYIRRLNATEEDGGKLFSLDI